MGFLNRMTLHIGDILVELAGQSRLFSHRLYEYATASVVPL